MTDLPIDGIDIAGAPITKGQVKDKDSEKIKTFAKHYAKLTTDLLDKHVRRREVRDPPPLSLLPLLTLPALQILLASGVDYKLDTDWLDVAQGNVASTRRPSINLEGPRTPTAPQGRINLQLADGSTTACRRNPSFP
jgi:hypothetical protein